MSRIYRRFLARGIRLYINNRLVEPFDPTYSMKAARHTKVSEIEVSGSRVVFSKVIQVKLTENHQQAPDNIETAPVTVRLYALPIEDWHHCR